MPSKSWRSAQPSEYNSWAGMIQRCTNPKRRDYPRYGGRGITVCERWHSKIEHEAGGYERFMADMGPKPSPLHQLDRWDNDGPYDPANCRWATPKEQAWNKQNTTKVTVDGTQRLLRDIAAEAGIDYRLAKNRQLLGLPLEKALAPPIKGRPVLRGDGALFPTVLTAARAMGISHHAIHSANRKGHRAAGFTWKIIGKSRQGELSA